MKTGEEQNRAISSEYNLDIVDVFFCKIFPLLPFLAKRVPRRITPNQLTLVAFLCATAGNIVLLVSPDPSARLIWIGLLFGWYVFDGLDGIHARLTDQGSAWGGFLDHLCDTIAYVLMFTAFIVHFELYQPFFVLAWMARMGCQATAFLTQAHTGKLLLGPVAGGFEFACMVVILVLSYINPNVDPRPWLGSGWLLSLSNTLQMHHSFVMKVGILIHFPVNVVLIINYMRFARQHIPYAQKDR